MGGVYVMLLGGKGGCQQCTCVPCDECTRTCTNPHTGTAFEAVYTRYFEGAEDGNASDGYLTANGDSDTSDPYDGMDGNGPWFQQVGGEFTLDPSTTRHPCGVTVSFWRNNYVLGASTIPPPATTTTMNRIRVSVSSLSETGVFVEGTYVAIGDTLDLNVTIPLVTGGGDQSTNDPRTSAGTATVTPECHNKTAIFTVQARLEWDVKKRQHVVYGLVRECYEIGTPCATACDGDPPPDTIYLEIKNVSLSGGATVAGLAGTYVMTRAPNFCDLWENYADLTCSVGLFFGYREYIVATSIRVGTISQSIRRVVTISGVSECVLATLNWLNTTPVPICGTGVIKSGTGGQITFANGAATTGTFDWEITA
jgi:hypothetical protein